MRARRSSGLLLHPSSLPSRTKCGIGDFGLSAYEFVDFLSMHEQKVWQVLPLGPVDCLQHNGCPYMSTSAFALNVCLVAPELLVRDVAEYERTPSESPEREGIQEAQKQEGEKEREKRGASGKGPKESEKRGHRPSHAGLGAAAGRQQTCGGGEAEDGGRGASHREHDNRRARQHQCLLLEGLLDPTSVSDAIRRVHETIDKGEVQSYSTKYPQLLQTPLEVFGKAGDPKGQTGGGRETQQKHSGELRPCIGGYQDFNDFVDFPKVAAIKELLLREAFATYTQKAAPASSVQLRPEAVINVVAEEAEGATRKKFRKEETKQKGEKRESQGAEEDESDKEERRWVELKLNFERFKERHHGWLKPFALFQSLGKLFATKECWNKWPEPFRDYRKLDSELGTRGKIGEKLQQRLLEESPEATSFTQEVDYHQFCQFVAYTQWEALKAYANKKDVQIFGDVSIYVCLNSSDVWSNTEIFNLDRSTFEPTFVSGVPPDYFSENGQLWGHPTYDWAAIRATGFRWWVDRVTHTLSHLVDLLRLDHWRGLEAFWAIPYKHAVEHGNAKQGEWVKAPGQELLDLLADKHAWAREGLAADEGLSVCGYGVGSSHPKARVVAPIIPEDLGVVTAEVVALRERYYLGSMKVLLFAWSTSYHRDEVGIRRSVSAGVGTSGDSRDEESPSKGRSSRALTTGPACRDADNDAGGEESAAPEHFAANIHLPQNYESNNCVVYTATHDNETTAGWYRDTATEAQKAHVADYTGFRALETTPSSPADLPLEATIHWKMISLAYLSVAKMAILPLQDLLGLDNSARFNDPGNGTSPKNWSWKLKDNVAAWGAKDQCRKTERDTCHLQQKGNKEVRAGGEQQQQKAEKEWISPFEYINNDKDLVRCWHQLVVLANRSYT